MDRCQECHQETANHLCTQCARRLCDDFSQYDFLRPTATPCAAVAAREMAPSEEDPFAYQRTEEFHAWKAGTPIPRGVLQGSPGLVAQYADDCERAAALIQAKELQAAKETLLGASRTPPVEHGKASPARQSPSSPPCDGNDDATYAEILPLVTAASQEVDDLFTTFDLDSPPGRALAVALNMAQCAILKQWPVRTAVDLALQEGDRYAGYVGYPCWSSTPPALFLAAWAKAYEASINPCPIASQEMRDVAENLLAHLPPDVFDSSSLLKLDAGSPLAMDPRTMPN